MFRDWPEFQPRAPVSSSSLLQRFHSVSRAPKKCATAFARNIGLREIDEPNDCEHDDDRGDTKAQHEPDIVPFASFQFSSIRFQSICSLQ